MVRWQRRQLPGLEESAADLSRLCLIQVGKESLNMRQAMKIMKEQAAAMAVQAQQQAQEAAVQKSEAEASLASANADLAEERSKFANLQVKPGQVASTLSRDENV